MPYDHTRYIGAARNRSSFICFRVMYRTKSIESCRKYVIICCHNRFIFKIWNSIPYSIKLLKRSSFRRKIKELLLNFLRSEDDYVEVSGLIKLFNTLG